MWVSSAFISFLKFTSYRNRLIETESRLMVARGRGIELGKKSEETEKYRWVVTK